MGTPKGHEKRGDEHPEAERGSSVPQEGRGRRGRGRSRRRGRAATSGERALPASESIDPERSGEHKVAVGFVELTAAAPIAVDNASANSNHRADIMLPRAPASSEQGAVSEPDAVGSQSGAADEAYRRRREADDTAASVLDAPYSMHPSAPPAPRPSWVLRVWVALMCGVICAAGVVAWKNHKEGKAGPQAPTSEESARAETGGDAPEAPDSVKLEATPAASTVLSPVAEHAGEGAAKGQGGDAHDGPSEPEGQPPAEEAEAKPARRRGRTSAPAKAASGEGEPASVTHAPAAEAPAERTPGAAPPPPEARLGGLPPGLAGGSVSGPAVPAQAAGAPRDVPRPASAEAAREAEPEGTRQSRVDSASLPQLPQNPYDTDTP